MNVTNVPTKPIQGQKPGTSGLRKKTKVFMQQDYLENFVQATLDALNETGTVLKNATLAISGDGRFYNDKAIQTIIKMAAAAGVKRVWCGTGGLLSTPAMSAVIRTRSRGLQKMAPVGGFILSASHNPGGIDEDFGIKYNCENGGPAPEKVTNLIYENTTKICQYQIVADLPDVDLAKPGSYTFGDFTVEVFDCCEDHVGLLKQVFDFGAIKRLIARPDFSLCYDSMHGVQGPYARRVLVDELGAPADSLINATPKPDFGGHASPSHGHADPNLTHAVELVATMGLNKLGLPIKTAKPPPAFGAAADGDADRNMIMGRQFFCSPSDSLAIIVANAQACIPYYAAGIKGCARSMPTSCALDLVAEKLGIPCFEVPTGWKFFGNLMDSGSGEYAGKPKYTPFICGEESFGTGGDHVREKDGMWAVLAWLQILAAKNPDASAPLVGVDKVCEAHWAEYGRNYYARYDYEGVDKEGATKMMDAMVAAQPGLIGTTIGGMKIAKADMFAYNDPVDGSVSKNQGVRFIFESGSRFVFRLSGTGVAGATVRMYLEKYEAPGGDLLQHAFDVVKPIADIALKVSKLEEFTGRTEPTVIT